MRKLSNLLAAYVFAVLPLCCPFAVSQSNSPPVAWEKQLPGSIDGYVSTSSGVLLVRSGKTLFALDDKDGRQLWSLKGLNTGSGRGNLLEIPNIPVLLSIHDEPGGTSEKPSSMLLAVDLRSGKLLCQLQGITNLYEVIAFYKRERILLITGPDPYYWPFKPQLHLLPMLKGDPVESQHFVKTSLGLLPSCPVEWQVKYPHEYRHSLFRVYDQELYERSQSKKEIARVDLQTGKLVWTFGGASDLDFADGKILIAGKDVSALDPVSGKVIWTAKDLDAVTLEAKQGVVFGTGKKGAFALDLSTGSVRWQVEGDGPAGDFEVFEESRLLVFVKKSGLVVVDSDSGNVLRRISVDRGRIRLLLPLPWPSVSVERMVNLSFLAAGRRVGSHFLLAPTARGLTLYDLTTGKELWTETVTHGLWFAAGPGFASKTGKNEWKLWRIDPSTGGRQEWVLNGEQPEVTADFGLAYTFTRDTLRAFKLAGPYRSFRPLHSSPHVEPTSRR